MSALGDLEQIAMTLASLQGTVFPKINKPWISIFAGDHGVVEENISGVSANCNPPNAAKFCIRWRSDQCDCQASSGSFTGD